MCIQFIAAFYRPQRSWAKVMFLQASVILLTWGCLPQCMLGYPTRSRHPPEQTPWEETPPLEQTPREQTPPRADTPQADTPEQTPTEQTPRSGHTPQEADSSIRSTSGRYASYWNAFLFKNKIKDVKYIWLVVFPLFRIRKFVKTSLGDRIRNTKIKFELVFYLQTI